MMTDLTATLIAASQAGKKTADFPCLSSSNARTYRVTMI